MIKNMDLYGEIEKLESPLVDEQDFMVKLLKANVLALKLLHNIRQNQTAIMKVIGAQKVIPKAVEDAQKIQR